MSLLRRVGLGVGLTALVLPIAVSAQTRDVVSKEVSVGRSEATLRLEFADDGSLEISFDDGEVLVGGDVVGSYEPGGELDAAWRELLGEAVRLDDGALAEMLSDWTVPADLAGTVADLAREIDRALEDAVNQVEVDVDPGEGTVSISVGDQSSLVRALLGSVSRLGVLEDALDGLGNDVRVHVDEDVVVGEDEVVESSLVTIGGTLRIEGEVDGDVVVVGGSLDLRDGGSVGGDVRLADARVLRNEGSVGGDVVDVLETERDRESEMRSRIREEVRDEIRSDLRNEIRNATRGNDDSFSIMAPLRPIVRGVTGVAENLLTILILGLIGAAFLAFAGDNVDVISETAKRAPGRAAIVGIAGSFLLVPVWILGTVALAVSIIGIPVAIAWLPLFPLAACAAALVGYLAVARNAGEWLADSEYPWTGWIRKSNAWVTMLGGLAGLMLAFVAAHVLSMAPFLGFFSGLLAFVGIVVTFLAIQIGFGAVLLTRGGRRREQWSYDPDAAWEAAMNIEVDVEGEPHSENRKGEDDDA